MYTTYFGLKEKPFRLVPDPEFLFLSTSHEEALAHLSYAVSQQEGFAEITGEVGTGKTTLCRSFLEELGPDVETAFIFNSKLDARQLLKAILAELAIDCVTEDTAEMTQALYLFLLEKKAQSKTVVLLIDEAQNLSRKTLEQLRLLSNLETTRNKLLQIILVGQPELSDLLNSYDMRQLRQRINLSCHIRPLSLEETRQYIRHRVNKASAHVRFLFSPRAVNLIYRYAKGTPRLINILCDRSLVAAFSLGKKKVTPDLVKIAFKEVDAGKSRGGRLGSSRRSQKVLAVFALACAGCLAASLFFFFSVTGRSENSLPASPDFSSTPSAQMTPDSAQGLSQNALKPSGPDQGSTRVSIIKEVPPVPLSGQASSAGINLPPPEPQKKRLGSTFQETVRSPMSCKTPKPVPVLSGGKEISSYLAQIVSRATRENVLDLVLSLWAEDADARAFDFDGSGKALSDARFFEIRAMQAKQLKVLHLLGNKNQIKLFNLPAILSFSVNGQTGFLAVTGVERQNLCLIAADDVQHGVKVDLGELAPFLSEDIYIVWKDIFGYAGLISHSSPPAAVISVKLALQQLGFEKIAPTATYDAGLVNAVKTVQKRYGLAPDGLVGPMTKIVLFQELETIKQMREKTDDG